MTDVPLVCAYAHCCTISRNVLANSAMNRMEIILRGIQYAQLIEGIQHARMFVSCISIRLVGTFSLRCLLHLVIFSKLKNSFDTLLELLSR